MSLFPHLDKSVNWSFFEKRVCLTTLAEEWAIGSQEFARVGLEVERFQSLPDIGPHQSFSKSEREILCQFWLEEKQTLLHLEDDCVFRELDHLEGALSELPTDWDIVYLGANLVCWNNGEPQPERFSEHLFRVRAAWTTHCVGYSRKGARHLLERQPGFSEIMFDNWMSKQLPDLNAYCVAPMVAYQRHRRSSIWATNEDYTPIFEASEARLR
jgi:hypothetical protein